MKTTNLLTLVAALILFSFTSCVKQMDVPASTPAPTETIAKSASDNFNWATTQTVQVNFNGTADTEYELVLRVLDADGSILLQKLQKANKSFQADVEVAAHYKTIIVTYGTESRQFDCTSGSVSMNIN